MSFFPAGGGGMNACRFQAGNDFREDVGVYRLDTVNAFFTVFSSDLMMPFRSEKCVRERSGNNIGA